MKIKSKKRWWTLFLTLSTFSISTITLLTLSSCAAAQEAAPEKIKILEKQDAEELGLYNKKIINQEDLKDFDEIGRAVFAFRENIEAVHFPSNIKKIGDAAFDNCKNLKRISFAKDSELKWIGRQAFLDTMIVSPFLPDSVTFIDRSAFSSPEITTFRYPNNMDVINLSEVEFFKRKNKAGIYFLQLPQNLRKITSEEGVRISGDWPYAFGMGFDGFFPIEGALNKNEVLPQTLEEILTPSAFGKSFLSSSLNGSLYIPGSVRTVNENFLFGCAFKNVYLPPHLYNAKDVNNKNKRYNAPEDANIHMWDGKTYPDEDKLDKPYSSRA